MNPFFAFVAVWLFFSCVLASVALASKMSFLAWLLVGLASPLIVLFLLGEYVVLQTRAPHKQAQLEV